MDTWVAVMLFVSISYIFVVIFALNSGNSSRRSRRSRRASPVAAARVLIRCAVCYEFPKSHKHYRKLRNCGHSFCVSCLRRTIKISIETRTVHSICCLGSTCDVFLDYHDDIKPLITSADEKTKKRFEELWTNATLAAMFGLEVCPKSKCSAVTAMQLTNFTQTSTIGKNRKCWRCGCHYCAACSTIFSAKQPNAFTRHKCTSAVCVSPAMLKVYAFEQDLVKYISLTPKDESERSRLESGWGKQRLTDELRSLQAVAGKRTCPICSVPTEQFGGCDTMRCQNCRTYWCFACGRTVDGWWHRC